MTAEVFRNGRELVRPLNEMIAHVFAAVSYAVIGLPVLYLVYVLLSHHPRLRQAMKMMVVHPDEAVALLRFYFSRKRKATLPSGTDGDEQYCYQSLAHVSRSFSFVILQLVPEIRLPICVYYLVCRALDTIEDDMAIPQDTKLHELRSFPEKLYMPDWKCSENYGAQNFHEMDLLHQYDKVSASFRKLNASYQKTILDCATEMAHGMVEYQVKSIESLSDYEQYCYYVAGVVGKGLTKIFRDSGLEPDMGEDDDLSISMGLFLQKTNIIRDYLEDIEQVPPRIFYPKEIWSKYVTRFEDLKQPEFQKEALKCLNHMVADALKHFPKSLQYLSAVRNRSVFEFCAVPQVMAITTLERCFDNYAVFTSNVKIRKGELAKMLMGTTSMASVFAVSEDRVKRLLARIPSNDPNAERLHINAGAILKEVECLKSGA